MIKLVFRKCVIFASIIGLAWVFSSCSTINKRSEIETFESFYDKFHKDYTFQKSRISFPIDGYQEDSKGRVNWSDTNWNLHKGKVTDIKDNTFKVTIQKEKKRVYERVVVPNSSFYFDRTFELKKRQWYLVQCIDKGME